MLCGVVPALVCPLSKVSKIHTKGMLWEGDVLAEQLRGIFPHFLKKKEKIKKRCQEWVRNRKEVLKHYRLLENDVMGFKKI